MRWDERRLEEGRTNERKEEQPKQSGNLPEADFTCQSIVGHGPGAASSLKNSQELDTASNTPSSQAIEATRRQRMLFTFASGLAVWQ